MKKNVITQRYHLRTSTLLMTFVMCGFIGCAGSQLSTEEQNRYDELSAERDSISQERAQLAKRVQADFEKSGQLESKTKALVKSASLSCGFKLNGQSFGPLPFKKKRGKQLSFGQDQKATRSGCAKHTLKIK